MPEMKDYAYGQGPGGGLGAKNGDITGPWDPSPFGQRSPNEGKSQKGGEPMGPFARFKESQCDMMIVTRDSMSAIPTIQGGISTPMDTARSEMPGVRGSDGTGPVSGGGAKISSPWDGPFGDMVGG